MSKNGATILAAIIIALASILGIIIQHRLSSTPKIDTPAPAPASTPSPSGDPIAWTDGVNTYISAEVVESSKAGTISFYEEPFYLVGGGYSWEDPDSSQILEFGYESGKPVLIFRKKVHEPFQVVWKDSNGNLVWSPVNEYFKDRPGAYIKEDSGRYLYEPVTIK
jgi:hypothetical protein